MTESKIDQCLISIPPGKSVLLPLLRVRDWAKLRGVSKVWLLLFRDISVSLRVREYLAELERQWRSTTLPPINLDRFVSDVCAYCGRSFPLCADPTDDRCRACNQYWRGIVTVKREKQLCPTLVNVELLARKAQVHIIVFSSEILADNFVKARSKILAHHGILL